MFSKRSKVDSRNVLGEKVDQFGNITRLVAVQSIMDYHKDKWFTVWTVERVYPVGRFQYWAYPTYEQALRSYKYNW